MTLGAVDFVIVGFYLVASLAIGVLCARRGTANVGEYFVAGRKLGWFLAGTSMVATSFAADTPLAIARLVRTQGLTGNWYWWSGAIAFVACTLLFAPMWQRARLLSDVELIELRYRGRTAAVLRGTLALHRAVIVNAVTLGWVILGMQKIAVETFGWSKTIAVPALVALSLVYTVLSGLWGVVMTDLFQFVLAMAGSIALMVLVYAATGGPAALVEAAMRSASAVDPSSLASPLASPDALISFLPDAAAGTQLTWMGFLFFVLVQWWGGVEGSGFVAQRLFATRNERHAALAMLWFTVAHFVVRTWPWIVVGLGSVIFFPLLADPEAAYPKMMVRFLPAGVRGLMVASLLAAFMSTVTTHLNWGASYLINDLWHRFVRRNASQRELVRTSQAFVLLTAALGAVVAYSMDSIYGAWLYVAEIGAGAVLVSIARWLWWRVTARAETAAIVVSVLAANLLRLLPGLAGEAAYPVRFALVLALGTVAGLVGAVSGPAEPMETLIAFYRRVRPPGFWGPVATRCPEIVPARLGALVLLAWGAGVAAVYAALVGVGWLCLGRTLEGTCLLGIGAAAAALLSTSMRKMSWLST